MREDKLAVYAQWATFVAVLLGLALVVFELRQSRDASLGERFVMAAEVEASIRTAIADHADIWQRGCMGEELTVTEKTAYRNLVWAFTYRYFRRWFTSTSTITGGGTNTFLDGMAVNIRDYPGFRQAWEDMGWEPEFQAAVDKRVSELGPALTNIDPSQCGI